MIGGGIRNQASESIDFLGYGGPCIFFIFFFEFLALFFARIITKSERGRGKEKDR